MIVMLVWACEPAGDTAQPEVARASAEAPTLADADRDGFADPDDACPDEPGLEPDGCPIRDRDHDGVLDPDDACPDEPECVNGFDDDDGCPDGLPEELAAALGPIAGVEFEIDKAILRPSSYPILDELAAFLLRYPDIDWVIEGHTSEMRDEVEKRRRPTQKRAESVRDYLLHKGVSAEKIASVGFGDSRPLASNKTREGQAQNRRIELHVADEHLWLAEVTCATADGDGAP